MAQREEKPHELAEEVQQIVTLVEELSGLRSRWNGTVTVLDTATATLLSHETYSAKKEWNCSITVLDVLVGKDRRWRTLIHEALHSVSVGLTPRSYLQFPLWEEAVVEGLQRIYRPAILLRLERAAAEAAAQDTDSTWRYTPALDALRRIAAELPAMPEQEFLERLLRTALMERKAMAFAWGRRSTDFDRFKRIYAEAAGQMNR